MKHTYRITIDIEVEGDFDGNGENIKGISDEATSWWDSFCGVTVTKDVDVVELKQDDTQ